MVLLKTFRCFIKHLCLSSIPIIVKDCKPLVVEGIFFGRPPGERCHYTSKLPKGFIFRIYILHLLISAFSDIMKHNSAIISFVILCMLSACKKSNSTSDSALYPSDIKIINGNWQLGNANIVLPDTIVIAITPKKIGDAKYYSYYFDSRFGSNGTITSFDTIIGGIYYIKAVWQLSNSNLPQTTTLYLFGNCNS